jgi:hypothetical protein
VTALPAEGNMDVEANIRGRRHGHV